MTYLPTCLPYKPQKSNLSEGYRSAAIGEEAAFQMQALDVSGRPMRRGGDVFRWRLDTIVSSSTYLTPALLRVQRRIQHSHIMLQENEQQKREAMTAKDGSEAPVGMDDADDTGVIDEHGAKDEFRARVVVKALEKGLVNKLAKRMGGHGTGAGDGGGGDGESLRKIKRAQSMSEKALAEETALRDQVEREACMMGVARDNGDGTYEITYTPRVAGQYMLKVEMLVASEEARRRVGKACKTGQDEVEVHSHTTGGHHQQHQQHHRAPSRAPSGGPSRRVSGREKDDNSGVGGGLLPEATKEDQPALNPYEDVQVTT